jgi:demethylmenaquinone methyltransferase/2-methoxy-6-polyprenyl-1,4-benzoquinol methylase
VAPTAPLPTGATKARVVRQMFDTIAPRYDLVNRLMTFGLDVRWRQRSIDALDLPAGSAVLDVACGTGDLCRELSRRGMWPVGIDLSAGMLAHARTDVPLILGDGLRLPFPAAAFDGVVSAFALRNVVDLGDLFGELARVVRPGGRIALLDVSEPDHPLLRAGDRLWSRQVVPRLGGLLSDGAAYRYLPRSLAYLPPPSTMVAMLATAGFVAVERDQLSGGITQLYVATRP